MIDNLFFHFRYVPVCITLHKMLSKNIAVYAAHGGRVEAASHREDIEIEHTREAFCAFCLSLITDLVTLQGPRLRLMVEALGGGRAFKTLESLQIDERVERAIFYCRSMTTPAPSQGGDGIIDSKLSPARHRLAR